MGEIEAARLRQLVAEDISIREMAKDLGVAYSTIRYWLKKLGLETNRSVRLKEGKAAHSAGLRRAYLRCPKHGRTAFLCRSDGGFRCAKCSTCAVSERRRRVKRQLVEEAGGECKLCGFDEHPAALQFHHLIPAGKAFQLSDKGFTRGIGGMRAEARKCALLCANCHALVEAGVKKGPGLER
jgi:transposase-like protein